MAAGGFGMCDYDLKHCLLKGHCLKVHLLQLFTLSPIVPLS